MTLKTRNLFFQIFLFTSLAVLLFALIIFLVSLHNSTILNPPALRIPAFLDRIPFTPKSVTALFVSFLLILMYVPACFYILLKFFENTQTSEIIFFSGFLIACLAEISRFITICLGLWLSFSNTLIFMGNVTLFGRTLAPLSFLCAAILSETSQRQDIERNYLIMMTVSVVFAVVIPMNTAIITSTALVTEGFIHLVNILRFMLLLMSTASFLVSAVKKNSLEHKYLAFSSAVILIGYGFLVTCDNFFFLIMGLFGLIYGTFKYLQTLHKMYMWG